MRGQEAAPEVKRARAALRRVQPETDESRALELAVLSGLIFDKVGLVEMERKGISDRMAKLAELSQSSSAAAAKAVINTPNPARRRASCLLVNH